MDTVQDFEDLLELLERHEVRYLIIGGLAFIFHAKPRFTKDMDLWIGPDPENVARANRALAEFGSPHLLEAGRPDEVLQLGVAPNRIDLLQPGWRGLRRGLVAAGRRPLRPGEGGPCTEGRDASILLVLAW